MFYFQVHVYDVCHICPKPVLIPSNETMTTIVDNSFVRTVRKKDQTTKTFLKTKQVWRRTGASGFWLVKTILCHLKYVLFRACFSHLTFGSPINEKHIALGNVPSMLETVSVVTSIWMKQIYGLKSSPTHIESAKKCWERKYEGIQAACWHLEISKLKNCVEYCDFNVHVTLRANLLPMGKY